MRDNITGEQERSLYGTSSEGQTERASADHTGTGRAENGTSDKSDERESGSDGTDESRQSDVVGTDDEQHQTVSGGNRTDGTDLQLNITQPEGTYQQLSLFPSFEEQVGSIAAAEASKQEQFSMRIGNKTYMDKKEAGTALVEMCKAVKATDVATDIGEYAGFKLAVSFDSFNHKFVMNVKGQLSHNMEVGSDPLGNITRINNLLESIPKHLEETKTKLETVEHQLETAKVEVKKPFAQETELADKIDRLSALNALLNMDEKGDDAIGMDDDVEQGDSNRVADKPANRVSLKEKLEVMKTEVATAGKTEQAVQKGVEKAEVL